MGGMEVGSIWGHGSYVAPDWTADWLHREAVFILDEWAKGEAGRSYLELEPERQAALRERLTRLMRRNGYDPVTRALTIEPVRARAFEANHRHYANIFANGHAPYAIPRGTVSDPERLRRLSAFFFWTAWAAATNRPTTDISYTSNWPPEPLIGNRPTGEAVVWTGVSVIVLLAGSARSSGGTSHRSTQSPPARCRRRIRWEAGARPRRSAQRSSTSRWLRRSS